MKVKEHLALAARRWNVKSKGKQGAGKGQGWGQVQVSGQKLLIHCHQCKYCHLPESCPSNDPLFLLPQWKPLQPQAHLRDSSPVQSGLWWNQFDPGLVFWPLWNPIPWSFPHGSSLHCQSRLLWDQALALTPGIQLWYFNLPMLLCDSGKSSIESFMATTFL